MNILHLTDFHIHNPKGENEAFRAGFYQEYLYDVLNEVKSACEIDYVFITGDIVNIFRHDNFKHAKEICNFILKQLDLNEGDIYFSNGNHDVSKNGGDDSYYKDFIKNYRDDASSSGSRHDIYKSGNDVILSLNSSGFNSNGMPEKLEANLMDEIIMSVRELSPDNIFVLSHHPAVSYAVQAQAMFDEDSSWSSSHLWADGGQLLNRLSNGSVTKGKVFWFAGDVHRPELTLIENNKILVTTGSCACVDYNIKTCSCKRKCNCLDKVKKSNLKPQFRIVHFSDSITSTIYEREPKGHNNKGLDGVWGAKVSNIDLFNACHTNIEDDQSVSEIVSLERNETGVIDVDYEKEITKYIKDKKLYHFGMLNKVDAEAPLSWIRITEMFNDNHIYRGVISRIQKVIQCRLGDEVAKKDCILVGVDNWGSILAARLSAGLNVRSCTIAVKGNRDSYDNLEVINDELVNIVKGKKIIILLSDVINTGQTVFKVINELSIPNESTVINISVFYDPTQNRLSDLSRIDESYYICGSVKLPIVSSDILPNQEYVTF